MEREYRTRLNPGLRVLRFIGFIILGALGAAAFAFIFGYLIMLLWNWLMPMLFGLTTITFWQAVGIAFLARLIFGGGKHSHNHDRERPSRDKAKREFMRHWKREHDKEYRRKNWCGDWRYFDDYWQEEGENAYNEFIERKKSEQKED